MFIFDFGPTTTTIVYDEHGKPKLYLRRWFILFGFVLSCFTFYLGKLRHVSLASEFALYFNTTNQVDVFGAGAELNRYNITQHLGIDFFLILDSIVSSTLYLFGGAIVDIYGLKILVIGSSGQALAHWAWYFVGDNYALVLACRSIAILSGMMIQSCMLRIASLWFSAEERPLVSAIVSVTSLIGGVAGLVIGPSFHYKGAKLTFDPLLLSCKFDEREVEDILKTNEIDYGNNGSLYSDDLQFLDFEQLGIACSEEAEENFCCYTPTNIDGLNLLVAVIATMAALAASLATKSKPPTAPSESGSERKGAGIYRALQLTFSHRNYLQLCIADLIILGPPLVLMTAFSRLFPPLVAAYGFVAGGIGIFLSVPATAIFAKFLSKSKKFYSFTAGSYVCALVIWTAGAVCLAIATDASEIFFLFTIILLLVFFTFCQMSVYELKAEYVFDVQYNLEGTIVSIDGVLQNVANSIFLIAIPPERISGDRLPGRLFTFLCGIGICSIGTLLALRITNKYDYRRTKYEDTQQKRGSMSQMTMRDLLSDIRLRQNSGNDLAVGPLVDKNMTLLTIPDAQNQEQTEDARGQLTKALSNVISL